MAFLYAGDVVTRLKNAGFEVDLDRGLKHTILAARDGQRFTFAILNGLVNEEKVNLAIAGAL